MADPDWIRDGAPVAELVSSATGGRVIPTTIHYTTKTLVVLANGARYSKATLRPVGDKGYHRKLIPHAPTADEEE